MAWLAVLGELFAKLLGVFITKKAETASQLGEAKGRSDAKAEDVEQFNQVGARADRARLDAEHRDSLRPAGDPSGVDSDPASAINQDPDGHYRD